MKDIQDEKPPNILYYTTIQFTDGTIESPHFLVFNALSDGVIVVKEHYHKLSRGISRIVMKETLYVNTQYIPEDTHILVPTNDLGIEDDFKDPVVQQEMVLDAEMGDTEDAMMSILPYEQDDDALSCRAFYMGPFLKADNEKIFIQKLLENPFEISQPVDFLWLYRPTGEWHEVKV